MGEGAGGEGLPASRLLPPLPVSQLARLHAPPLSQPAPCASLGRKSRLSRCALRDSYSVLLLGPSNTSFSETSPGEAMPNLIEAELSARAPEVRWQCRSERLFFGDSMARRAVSVVRRQRPDLVILVFASPAFSMYAVVYRLQQSARWLYRPTLKAAQMLKAFAGGAAEGSPGLRGQIFRIPRYLAARVFGLTTVTTVDDAITSTREALDSLLREEDLSLVCRLTVPVPYYADQAEEDARRVRRFNSQVGDYCEERHVTFYDLSAKLREAGRVYKFWDDHLHPSIDTRRFEAGIAAEIVLREAAR